mmetsp:Transcript_17691/g.57421  ORF Transcript_17691/g.57421 Transcript_17691/m.57421 type:complete len:282 (+) Transcript_17691:592-1437(+)
MEAMGVPRTKPDLVRQCDAIRAHRALEPLHGGQEVLQLQNPGHQLGDLVADLRLPGLRRAPAPDRHARRDERASDAQRGLGDGDRRRCKVREARRHFRGRARGSVRHGSRRKRDVHGLRGDVALAHPSVPRRRGAAREGRPKLAGTSAECLEHHFEVDSRRPGFARAHPLRHEVGEDECVPGISGELRAESREVVVVCEGITSKRQPTPKAAPKGGTVKRRTAEAMPRPALAVCPMFAPTHWPVMRPSNSRRPSKVCLWTLSNSRAAAHIRFLPTLPRLRR